MREYILSSSSGRAVDILACFIDDVKRINSCLDQLWQWNTLHLDVLAIRLGMHPLVLDLLFYAENYSLAPVFCSKDFTL